MDSGEDVSNASIGDDSDDEFLKTYIPKRKRESVVESQQTDETGSIPEVGTKNQKIAEEEHSSGPFNASSQVLSGVQKRRKKGEKSAKALARKEKKAEDLEAIKSCKVTNMVWVAQGYYNVQNFYYPCIVIPDERELNMTTRKLLRRDGVPKPGKIIGAYFDEKGKVWFGNVDPRTARDIPYVPGSDRNIEFEKQNLKDWCKKNQISKKSNVAGDAKQLIKELPSVVSQMNEIYETALAKSNEELERQKKELEEAEKANANSKRDAALMESFKSHENESVKKKAIVIEAPVAKKLSVGDHVFLFSHNEGKVICRIETVNSASAFPIELNRRVDSRSALLKRDRKLERLIPKLEAKKLVGEKFDEEYKYVTPYLSIEEFHLMDGRSGNSESDKLIASVKQLQNEIALESPHLAVCQSDNRRKNE